MEKLKKKSDAELDEWMAMFNPETVEHMAGMREIQRRQAAPVKIQNWIGIGIAALLLVIAVITFFGFFQP